MMCADCVHVVRFARRERTAPHVPLVYISLLRSLLPVLIRGPWILLLTCRCLPDVTLFLLVWTNCPNMSCLHLVSWGKGNWEPLLLLTCFSPMLLHVLGCLGQCCMTGTHDLLHLFGVSCGHALALMSGCPRHFIRRLMGRLSVPTVL